MSPIRLVRRAAIVAFAIILPLTATASTSSAPDESGAPDATLELAGGQTWSTPLCDGKFS